MYVPFGWLSLTFSLYIPHLLLFYIISDCFYFRTTMSCRVRPRPSRHVSRTQCWCTSRLDDCPSPSRCTSPTCCCFTLFLIVSTSERRCPVGCGPGLHAMFPGHGAGVRPVRMARLHPPVLPQISAQETSRKRVTHHCCQRRQISTCKIVSYSIRSMFVIYIWQPCA